VVKLGGEGSQFPYFNTWTNNERRAVSKRGWKSVDGGCHNLDYSEKNIQTKSIKEKEADSPVLLHLRL
jgi:hypothetical protein